MQRRLRFEVLRKKLNGFEYWVWGLEGLGGLGWWWWVGYGRMDVKVVRTIPI